MTDPTLLGFVLIGIAALVASALTLFSGFGLGTLLMPAFALLVPVEAAVALTAVVHLANNLFKTSLLGRHADRAVAIRFGVPAALAAFAGAAVLDALADAGAIAHWSIGGHTFAITAVKLVVGLLMVLFALIEVLPAFERWSVPPRYLPLGGLLSGFFGGLSGHQGAFRSAFLVRSGLSTEAFIGTGVVIAVLVDLTRLPVYAASMWSVVSDHAPTLAVAIASALLGVAIGTRLLPKVTIRAIRLTVSACLIVLGIGLSAGAI